jgi:hypothetical protein
MHTWEGSPCPSSASHRPAAVRSARKRVAQLQSQFECNIGRITQTLQPIINYSNLNALTPMYILIVYQEPRKWEGRVRKRAEERIKFKRKKKLNCISRVHKFTSIIPSNPSFTYSWFLIEIAVKMGTLKLYSIERIELIQLPNPILTNFSLLSLLSQFLYISSLFFTLLLLYCLPFLFFLSTVNEGFI